MNYSQIKKQLIKAYDKDAPLRQNRNGGTRKEWKKDELESFTELLKHEGKQTILELGCGTGIDATHFKEEGFQVLATDFSPKMIEACKSLNLNAMVLDIYDLNALNKTFDAIYSMNVLLHIPREDIQMILDSISKKLKTNGVFYYGSYGGKDEEKLINDKTRMGEERFFSFLSEDTLLNVVDKCFDVIDFHTIKIKEDDSSFVYQSLTLRKRI